MELLTRNEYLHDLSVSIAMLTNPHVHFLPDCEEVDQKLAELIREMEELLKENKNE